MFSSEIREATPDLGEKIEELIEAYDGPCVTRGEYRTGYGVTIDYNSDGSVIETLPYFGVFTPQVVGEVLILCGEKFLILTVSSRVTVNSELDANNVPIEELYLTAVNSEENDATDYWIDAECKADTKNIKKVKHGIIYTISIPERPYPISISTTELPERKYVAIEMVRRSIDYNNKIADVNDVTDFLESTEMATLGSFEEVFGKCTIGYTTVSSLTSSESWTEAHYELESTEIGGLFVKIKAIRIEKEEETTSEDETLYDKNGVGVIIGGGYDKKEKVIVEVAIVDAFGEREIIFRRDYSAETGTGAETVD
jgi:hypothetical protein